jgi:hypothetical protein
VNDRQGCDSNSAAYTCDSMRGEHDKERKNCYEEIQRRNRKRKGSLQQLAMKVPKLLKVTSMDE